MIQNNFYFRNKTSTDKEPLKKSLLDMEFAKWEIRIKKHGLGHTIP